jgi:ribonuclease HII
MTAALRRVVREALSALTECADHVVVDGHPMRVAENETAVIGGDGRVAAIAAASILAKVTRDALMVEMSSRHPEYIFEINKGYGTPEHLAAIDAFGLTPQHRRSFMPCGGTERLF